MLQSEPEISHLAKRPMRQPKWPEQPPGFARLTAILAVSRNGRLTRPRPKLKTCPAKMEFAYIYSQALYDKTLKDYLDCDLGTVQYVSTCTKDRHAEKTAMYKDSRE
jgi:hypothetical protein